MMIFITNIDSDYVLILAKTENPWN